jgi:hypothetical protein
LNLWRDANQSKTPYADTAFAKTASRTFAAKSTADSSNQSL